MKISYQMTGNPAIPAVVHRGEHTTPVWLQQDWQEGEFAEFIRCSGCGHCCTAMAANLLGASITPYEEYLRCREMFGAPEGKQFHFTTVPAIVEVLGSLRIPAKGFGVKKGGGDEAAAHIMQALRQEKMVIFVSEPSERLPDNPFSSGHHYVLLVGLTEDGQVLVANSSRRATDKGVQLTDEKTIAAAVHQDCDPKDITWGELERFHDGFGYVVVG